MAGNQEIVEKASKLCSKCKLVLPVTNFSKNKKASSGINYSCKLCRKASYIQNKSKVLADAAKYYKENRDQIIRRQAIYQALHSEARASYLKKWRASNLENRRAYENGWQKVKRKTDPTHRLKRNMSTAIYNSLVHGKGKNNSSWQSLVGYTISELRHELESKFQENMTWDNYGKWHIDHIVPLDYFKVTDYDDPNFKVAWGLSNLQPLWAIDNMKKSNKLEVLY